MKKTVLTLIGLLLAAWGLYYVAIAIALTPSIKTTVYGQATSPDRQREARVQFSDCGATCGFDREVYVRSRAMPYGECRVLLLRGEPVVMLRWTSARVLQLSHSAPREDILDQSSHCEDVQVRLDWTPPAAHGPIANS